MSCNDDGDKNPVWSDEFNGSDIDRDKWNFDIGSGYGAGELEYYTDPESAGKQNISIVEDVQGVSALRISARNSPVFHDPDEGDYVYTSGRLTTKGLFSFTRGRVEARMKLPFGRGMWPALWLVGDAIGADGSGWPRCGEIDIFEMVGGTPYSGYRDLGDSIIYGTLHWGDSSNSHLQSDPNGVFVLDEGNFSDGYHIFAIEWTSSRVSWYVDGHRYFSEYIPEIDKDAFQNPFFIIVNLAIGGNWPGPPDGTTIFPQHLYVDWIRVYKY